MLNLSKPMNPPITRITLITGNEGPGLALLSKSRLSPTAAGDPASGQGLLEWPFASFAKFADKLRTPLAALAAFLALAAPLPAQTLINVDLGVGDASLKT